MLGLGFKTLPRTCTRIFFSVIQQTTCLFGFLKIFFLSQNRKTRILKTKEIFFFFFLLSENRILFVFLSKNKIFLRTEKPEFLKQKKSFFFFFYFQKIESFLFSFQKTKFLRTETTEFFKQKNLFFSFQKKESFFFCLCLVKQGLVLLKKKTDA